MAAQTLIINNFSGRLTRIQNGDINSGYAKFDTSFGYNPFFKPGNLTWFKAPGDLSSLITNGIALASASRVESGSIINYIITSTGHLYRILGEGGSGSDIHTLATGSPTFTYGADIQFYGVGNTLYVSHDLGVTKITLDSSGNFVSEAQVGTWDATHFTAITTRRTMIQFNGLLYAVNGDPNVTYANNIAEISTGGVVNSYAKLSPSLPAGTYIRDLDVSPDFSYLLMSASLIPSELVAPVNDTGNSSSSVSDLYKWNGTDIGTTAGIALPNFGITALQSFGASQIMFMYDTFGACLYDGTSKILTMRNNKSPFPSATATAGNFVTWMCPDFYWNLDTSASAIYGSLYYYGQLDADSPPGLWRMFRQASAIGGTIYQIPFQAFTTNRYISVNTNDTVQVNSNGTHIFSFIDYSGSGGATNNKFYYFYIAPPDDSPSGWTAAIAGVYETQTQLFSKKQTIRQIRVYCEPTVANNGFSIDLIGSDGKKIANSNGSYTYASGTDVTRLQGSLDMINFDLPCAPTYALGLRITNSGSANMCIRKVEIDIDDAF